MTYRPFIAYSIVENIPGKPIILKDCCKEQGGMSLTNGVEHVVAELWRLGMLPDNRRVLYYDSEGELTEAVHDCGLFKEFKFPVDVP